MGMRYGWKLASVGAAAAIFLGSACESPDWENPEYVKKKVLDTDPVTQRTAIERLSQLPEDKQKEVVPALVQVYQSKGPNQKDAMQLLVQLRDASAKDAYLNELETNETGYAGASAEALGEANAKDAVPKMLEILAKTDKNDVKVGIIQAFGHMPTPEMVPPLVEVLKLDVDSNPIQLHAYACEVLGNLAMENKEAITEDALKQITLAVFFGNMAGQSLDLECGLAIQKIGAPAIPPLLAIFKGEREDVQKLMMKYDTGEASFPQNAPKLIAAKRLTSLRAQEAVEPFKAFIDQPKQAPKEVTGMKANQWRLKEAQVTSEAIMGLGDLGATGTTQVLQDIVKGQYVNDEWADMNVEWSIELQLRQDSAFSLNRMPHRESVPLLLEVADTGVIGDLEKRSVMLEKGGNPPKQEERYQFNWMILRTAAMLSDGSDVDKFEALVQKTSQKYADLGKKMGEFLPVVRLAAECAAKGDAAAQAGCYAAKLADNRPEIREKAAWELGRLPDNAGSKAIIDNLGTEFLDTREILTFNLYRMPSKEALAKVDEILEKEKSKGGPDYRLDRYRLQLLRAFLRNNLK